MLKKHSIYGKVDSHVRISLHYVIDIVRDIRCQLGDKNLKNSSHSLDKITIEFEVLGQGDQQIFCNLIGRRQVVV